MAPALHRARAAGLSTALSPVFKLREEAQRGSPLFLEMVEDAGRGDRAVTSTSLARAHLEKARVRREMLEFLRARHAHSDVVRKAQELVELATKAMLRHVGGDEDFIPTEEHGADDADAVLAHARFAFETAEQALVES